MGNETQPGMTPKENNVNGHTNPANKESDLEAQRNDCNGKRSWWVCDECGKYTLGDWLKEAP